MRRHFLFAAALLFPLLTTPLSAQNQQFLITKIADTSMQIPGDTHTFEDLFDARIIDGQIAFQGWSAPIDGIHRECGIYTPSGNSIRPLVDTNTLEPGTTDTFSIFAGFSIDGDDLAFNAGRGIYMLHNGTITTVVDLNTPVPGFPEATFSGFQNEISLDDGAIAFGGYGYHPSINYCGEGLYLSSGGSIQNIVLLDTTYIPGTTTKYVNVYNPSIYGQSVAFCGYGRDNGSVIEGIYQYSAGQIVSLVQTGTTILPSGLILTNTHAPFSRSRDSIAFKGIYDGGSGFYLRTADTLEVIADTSTLLPDGSRNFVEFNDVSIDEDHFAFTAQWHTHYNLPGLYTNLGGSITEVARTGVNGIATIRLTEQAISGNTIVFQSSGSNSSAIYRADLVDAPPPQPRLEPPPQIPPIPAETRNLVVITHGRNTDLDTFNLWVRGMEQDIDDWIANSGTDANEWAVISYNWTTDSCSYDFYSDAISHGTALGKTLASLNYDHIHLIGHSAGSALITAAAEEIELRSTQTDTHLTYLDAYSPLPAYTAWYGIVADQVNWAEQYFDVGLLPGTQLQITSVHNVDITDLRPDGEHSHSWPRVFYRNTVTTQMSDRPVEWGPYGFPLSREAGITSYDSWNPATEYPPTGDDPVLLQMDDDTNFVDDVSTVMDGIVETDGTSIEMQTASPAWLTAGLNIAHFIDLMTLDVEFLSDTGAEGLLSVFWDSEVVGTVDERYEPSGLRKHLVGIPSGEPGFHTLSFRLDPFTEISSRVVIDHVQCGSLVSIPPADFNSDGDVDGDDFLIWQANFGGSGLTRAEGDANNDSDVDHYDFLIWQANFGTSHALPGNSLVVPEPSGTTCLLLGILGMFAFCRFVSDA